MQSSNEAELKQQLAAAKAEIDALVKVLGDKGDTIREKDKQLAERDLVISKMREAFEKIDSRYMSLPQFACEALALQPSTEALDAYVDEQIGKRMAAMGKYLTNDASREAAIEAAVLEEREACAALCDQIYRAGRIHGVLDCSAAIRGMEL